MKIRSSSKSFTWTIILIGLLLFRTGFSQTEIGLKIGMVNAIQEWDYQVTGIDLGNESRMGFDVGIFLNLMEWKVLSLNSEIRYVQKGITSEFSVTDPGDPSNTVETVTLKPRADYLSVAPILHGDIPLPLNPYILIAPRLDILVHTVPDGFNITYRNLRTIDFGITAGIGAEFPLTDRLHFLTEFRYEPSLINTYDTETLKIRNSSYSVLLGVSMK